MKKTSTEFTFFIKSGITRLLVIAAFFVLGVPFSYAQQSSARDQIGDLSHLSWKSPSGIDAVVQSEIARMDAAITLPDTPDPDRAIFKGYKRLVNYIDLNIQGGKPVGESILDGYEKVMAEALVEPDLKQMPENSLINLIPTLIESLIAVPVPENFQGQ